MMRSLFCMLLCGWVASSVPVFAQGSLTPPGPPGPVMKTLLQIEPRTPISVAGSLITNSGSYYLTTNLTATAHGVTISASGVTLDLMGFGISGDRGAGDYGVYLEGVSNAPVTGVTVKNGLIMNFTEGVRAQYTQNGRFDQLMLFSNTTYGINLYGRFGGRSTGNIITDCTIYSSGTGIYCDGNSAGYCGGNIISGCTISYCSSYGISFSGVGGMCEGNRVTDCLVTANVRDGVKLWGDSLGGCNDMTIDRCVINANGTNGIIFYSNSTGTCDGVTVSDCAISENGSPGITIEASATARSCDNHYIHDCTIYGNSVRGIYMFGSRGTRVEDNHITRQSGATTRALYAASSWSNMFFRNTAVGQSSNYFIEATTLNTHGPIVTNKGALATTNGTSGLSPWANFSR